MLLLPICHPNPEIAAPETYCTIKNTLLLLTDPVLHFRCVQVKPPEPMQILFIEDLHGLYIQLGFQINGRTRSNGIVNVWTMKRIEDWLSLWSCWGCGAMNIQFPVRTFDNEGCHCDVIQLRIIWSYETNCQFMIMETLSLLPKQKNAWELLAQLPL